MQVSIVGAHIKIYINGNLYRESQQVSWTIDYGESEIYGIDSVHPQEIAPGRQSCQGRISGIRTLMSGGLQGSGARGLVGDILSSPYVSIRIQDRRSGEDLLFLPQAKVSQQQVEVTDRKSVV